jgi:Flp pilus assembly protein TadG
MMRRLTHTEAAGAARRGFRRSASGAAAVEFAIWTAALIVPILSAVDLGFYIQKKMQLDTAGRAAAQAAWRQCDVILLPAVQNCTGVATTITTAAHTTSLGTAVTVPTVTEDYYCVNASNVLVRVGTTASPGTAATPPVRPTPNDCHTVVATNITAPGDYMQVTVSYAYAPVFTGVSLAALLTTPITRTVWVRLN